MALTLIFTAVFSAGVASLQMELSLLREATFLLGSTARTNSFIISIFLGGLALGSYFGNRLVVRTKTDSRLLFAISQGLNIGVILLFVWTKGAILYESYPLSVVAAYFGTMTLIPAFVAGMAFSLFLNMLFAYGETYIAWVYAVSTIGNVLSGFAHGMIFVPYFGMMTTYVVAVVSTGLAIVCVYGSKPAIKLSVGIGSLVAAAVVATIPPVPPGNDSVLWSKDDVYGLVQVVDRSEDWQGPNGRAGIDLLVHHLHNCANSPTDIRWHDESVLFAMKILDDEGKRGLNLGYCSGSSVAKYLEYPSIEQVVTLEMNKTVLEAAALYFPDIHERIAADGRSEVVVDEFRSWLNRQPQDSKYDIIMVDVTLEEPYYQGMFTREFFQRIHDHLAEKGVLFLHYQSFLRTGADVFEHVYEPRNLRDGQGFLYYTNFELPQRLLRDFVELDPLAEPGLVYSDRKIYRLEAHERAPSK